LFKFIPIMKNLKFIKFTALLIVALSYLSFVGVPDEISSALKTGNTKVLTQKMNTTIELVILDKENVYSNIQAEQILNQFFKTHQPISFKVLHSGGSENSKYYIGSLKTKNETYRVYYLLKTKEKTTLLYQLRIESDE